VPIVDNIGQPVSVLQTDLEQLEQQPPDAIAQIRERLSEQGKRISEITSNIHAILHRLHS
jgi:hypothetical protein